MKIVPIVEKLPTMALVVICLSIFGAALWVNITFARPSARELNQGRSSAFQGKNIQDPLREPEEANIHTINTQAYPLEGFVPANTNVLRVSFLYQCSELCPQLWLTFLAEEQEKSQIPIHHPALVGLNWFHISDTGLTIYQKNPTFHSINELIQANPPGILTEKSIAREKSWESRSVSYIEDTKEITDQQYVITTREPLSKLKDWYRFTKLVDINGIQRDASGQVTFFIEQTPTNSNPQIIKVANISVATLP